MRASLKLKMEGSKQCNTRDGWQSR